MGYFKIERDFLESELWLSEPFTPGQAWVDLIGLANYADKDRYYNGKFQTVKRGQVVTSYRTLADRWKWSRGRVSHFIHALEEAKMVDIDKATKWTTLTIVNYGLYQDTSDNKRANKKTNEGQTKDNKKTNEGLQEESKEIKNTRRERASADAGVSPSLEEVISYQREAGIEVDPEAFWNYYEGNGWMRGSSPVRNWKAVMRGWVGKPVYKQEKTKAEEIDEVTRRWLEQ